ncbi:hypothetical protein [Magnetospirillum sp. UT-4]|uniref:hypothetical protein n=1 Tax=Magnetospirillum sp. UT-4 TaxID=2681467 RepID=UPI001380D4EB|nr:hypothetical protein [Magnetospirillum sp. UT-4]CAA7621146.1 hypothetical protein MTBUT4_380023 [Magnetospirillum sp. UT-4]
MDALELLEQRSVLQRWVETYTGTQGRAPFVREAAAALRMTEAAIAELVDDAFWMYLAHPGRALGARTIELEGE